MTTKETAEAIGVSERTIRRHAESLGLTENGKETELDEKAVTIIKARIERSGRNDLDNVVQVSNVSTELEMMILDAKVSEWKNRKIAELTRSNDILKIENDEMRPKALFFDAVTNSKDAIEMKDAAKVLNISGMGRNNLFQFLRDHQIVMTNNTPFQAFIDRGYFRVIEQKYTKPDGDVCINLKTVVYQKGLDFIRREIEKAVK
jgi:phage antirepressor YoqD-like protein